MIISISGLHGTGKSTIAKKVADAMNLQYYSTGNAFRKKAADHNMSLEKFTKYVEGHPEIDNELDDLIIEEAKKGNIVVESQLSSFLLKSIADVKIRLTCPLKIRVQRMAERDGVPYDEKLRETLLREESEALRFKRLYDIDINDIEIIKQHHDYIIDTAELSIEQVFNELMIIIKN